MNFLLPLHEYSDGTLEYFTVQLVGIKPNFWMKDWQYSKGLINFRPVFRLAKLAFLRARATLKKNTITATKFEFKFTWKVIDILKIRTIDNIIDG